ncbi:MAG: CpXC domain-containing protein [Treponema sp.]|jgi:hypothetical protein|nr:CpXC domain-containing protein [Treponema sp.]
MNKRIPCICENSFVVEVSEEIDLDKDSAYLEQILNGTFFNFACPSCGKINKPEFPILLNWPSKGLKFEVIPELERGEFYQRKKTPTEKNQVLPETIIGYPEMAERLAIIRDGYNPVPVEAIKYNLQLKAEEQYPDNDMEVRYYRSADGSLEFHILGIKENEVAVMKVPVSTYERTLNDYESNPKAEIFKALRFRTYMSYKNTMYPGAL